MVIRATHTTNSAIHFRLADDVSGHVEALEVVVVRVAGTDLGEVFPGDISHAELRKRCRVVGNAELLEVAVE